MITIIATLFIKEGKMEEAIRILKQIVPKIRESEPNCISYIPHLLKGKKNKNKIIFYEKYKDENAFTDHMANLPKNFEKIFPLLEKKIESIVCNEII
ncbi:MAG: putative quinol monooxygenase [Candidatus Helarchaeota archaeon]